MNISNDIILYMFDFLTPHDLFNLFLNKHFLQILNNKYIWDKMFNKYFKKNNSVWKKSKKFFNSLFLISMSICPLCQKKVFENYILTISDIKIKKSHSVYFIPNHIVYHQKCLEPFNINSFFSKNIYHCPVTNNSVFGFKGYVLV